jgi:hypothetical protein
LPIADCRCKPRYFSDLDIPLTASWPARVPTCSACLSWRIGDTMRAVEW